MKKLNFVQYGGETGFFPYDADDPDMLDLFREEIEGNPVDNLELSGLLGDEMDKRESLLSNIYGHPMNIVELEEFARVMEDDPHTKCDEIVESRFSMYHDPDEVSRLDMGICGADDDEMIGASSGMLSYPRRMRIILNVFTD